MESEEIYTRIIQEYEYRQIRLCISIFRDVEYLHLREYFLDFDEEWKPSNKGISIPLDLCNTKELFVAFSEILSLAESRETIEEYFGDIIRNVYQ